MLSRADSASIGLPEIVEMEVNKVMENEAKKAVVSLHRNVELLRQYRDMVISTIRCRPKTQFMMVLLRDGKNLVGFLFVSRSLLSKPNRHYSASSITLRRGRKQ